MKKVFKNTFIFLLGIAFALGTLYYFKDSIIELFNISKVTITENSIKDAVDKVYDTVVVVENYKNDKLSATGTGFIYKVDNKYSYILTNYHVISSNDKIKIVLSNGKEIDANYLGGDIYLDVAVLTVSNDNELEVATIGKSSSVYLGDTVFTIGTPIDSRYKGTVTRGILSGNNRIVTVTGNDKEQYVMKVLQTDAAMNPGNSGGPLCNINGEVIGINSLKIIEKNVEGIGFAIPIEDVMKYINSLETNGEIKRPYLGIETTDAVDNNIATGILVKKVIVNKASYNILKENDLIIKVNDIDVKTSAYFKYELYKYNVGDVISLTIKRGSETKKVEIKLLEK